MEGLETVLQWLNTLELGEPPLREDPNPEPHVPTTPNGSRTIATAEDGVSPTNTNFSSIFDGPRINSPRERKPHSHASTSASSAGSDSDNDERCVPNPAEAWGPLLAADEVIDPFLAPTSGAGEGTDNPLHDRYGQLRLAPEPAIPGTIHQVFITSCYQCLLAGLPCSRTLPGCSRCKRAGCQHLCLLHRRKLLQEMVLGDGVGNRTPVLLKVKGEDGEVWERKVELLHEVKHTDIFCDGQDQH